MTTSPASLLTIFGATGDLAQRMLLPSLYGLQGDGLLPASMRILGTARSGLDDDTFRTFVADAIARFVPADQRRDDTLQARARFQKALRQDPNSARALTGLAAAYLQAKIRRMPVGLRQLGCGSAGGSLTIGLR